MSRGFVAKARATIASILAPEGLTYTELLEADGGKVGGARRLDVKVTQGTDHDDDVRVHIPSIGGSAYDELAVAESHVVVSGNAVYNFIPSNFRTYLAGTGAVVAEDGLFKASTGTTALSYGTLQSFRSINYKTGQGASFRFSARFPSNAASTWIGAGAISLGDEMSFGYNGTEFGTWHRYGGLAEARTLQVTTPAGGSENATVTINDDVFVVPLTAGTVQHNAKELADYVTANTTAWVATQLDDSVIFAAQSDGAKSGTYSFSSSTAAATITQDTAGVAKTSNHTPVADWNGESVVGLDPAKGNNYQIKYKNGFGDIEYYVADTDYEHYILVHRVLWTNTQTTPNLTNPSMRAGCYAASIGSTTDVSVECAYLTAFVSGKDVKTRNPRTFDNTKTSVTTTLTNILTIRNKVMYNGKNNQIEIEPIYLTLANDGVKSAVFELRGNPTVAGDDNFQNVGTNLVSESDIAGAAVTENGRFLASFVVARLSSISIDLTNFHIRMPPTLKLVVGGKMAQGTGDLSAALTWYEDI